MCVAPNCTKWDTKSSGNCIPIYCWIRKTPITQVLGWDTKKSEKIANRYIVGRDQVWGRLTTVRSVLKAKSNLFNFLDRFTKLENKTIDKVYGGEPSDWHPQCSTKDRMSCLAPAELVKCFTTQHLLHTNLVKSLLEIIQHLVHICGDEDVIVLQGIILFCPFPHPRHSNVSLQFFRKPELFTFCLPSLLASSCLKGEKWKPHHSFSLASVVFSWSSTTTWSTFKKNKIPTSICGCLWS